MLRMTQTACPKLLIRAGRLQYSAGLQSFSSHSGGSQSFSTHSVSVNAADCTHLIQSFQCLSGIDWYRGKQ